MIKELYDDLQRWKRDSEMNNQLYDKLIPGKEFIRVKAADIKVGDIIRLHVGERTPADMILLHTTEKSGAVFIKTDQLDGETDWKLRLALKVTQSLFPAQDLKQIKGFVKASQPDREIYKFLGSYEIIYNDVFKDSLSLDNTLWANTVIASGSALGMVIYTGEDTRMQMNSSNPRSKSGKIDLEINTMSIGLLILTATLAFLIICLSGFNDGWNIKLFRFVLLLSYIIPISLRVNLDLARLYYSHKINKDNQIADTIVRNTNIPEDLGRIQYLFTDKTGTLTQNNMVFKKLFADDSTIDVVTGFSMLRDMINDESKLRQQQSSQLQDKQKNKKREAIIYDLIFSMILCHNVTPHINETGAKDYQASSPDEIAIVKFADSLGFKLLERDHTSITISDLEKNVHKYIIDAIFPFSSETKRMGILLHEDQMQSYTFYLKGAEIIVKEKVSAMYKTQLNDACNTLALEGLRTLAFGYRSLTYEDYTRWNQIYTAAKCSNLVGQEEEVRKAVDILERELTFLGVTGVEDKLQKNVQITIESLKQAGISVWMLTGDKVETAKCIAISSGLKSSSDKFYQLELLPSDTKTLHQKFQDINSHNDKSLVLIIDGITLKSCLNEDTKLDFFNMAQKLCGVVCCRCSPLQKSQIVKEMKRFTGKRCAAIGDGGNDVGMILEADVGIGIVGKEGKQASLAADFSITQFCHLKQLLLWHGRLSYLRTIALTEFIVHRGLIISILQTVFSMIFYYCAISVYSSYLMLGYATYYTFLPVFSLVLDEDISCQKAMNNPKLYEELQKGRLFGTKAKLSILIQSLFQGCAIMFCGLLLFDDSFVNIVIITFSSLICIELLNILTVVCI